MVEKQVRINMGLVYGQVLNCIDQGSGCNTAVERTPHNTEVVGSSPKCWAFSHLYPLSSAFFIQVPRGGA